MGWSGKGAGHLGRSMRLVLRVFARITEPQKSIQSVLTGYLVKHPSLTESLAWME